MAVNETMVDTRVGDVAHADGGTRGPQSLEAAAMMAGRTSSRPTGGTRAFGEA